MAFTDEDIRIYGDSVPVPESGMGEEESAALYVSHKENGNLEKTRQLGELLAQTLVGDVDRLMGEPYGRQKLVLLSFLISDELEEKLSDGMLRQSAAAFRRKVEELDPAVFALITDSTAFTLYILHDRKVEGGECGRVLADLCDRDGDEVLIRDGDALAEEYRGLFSGIIQSYTFQ